MMKKSVQLQGVVLGKRKISSASGISQILLKRIVNCGSLSIVYQAEYHGESVMVKELYPEGLAEQGIIRRDKDGNVEILNYSSAINNMYVRFCEEANILMSFRHDPSMADVVTAIKGIYFINHTVCTISADENLVSWDSYHNESPWRILAMTVQIAEIVEMLHSKGYLLVDTKASNFIVNGTLPHCVKLVDFNSAVRLDALGSEMCFLYSNETAAPEYISGRGDFVGPQSDVFCMAAMLFLKLTGQTVCCDTECVIAEFAKTQLSHWRKPSVDALSQCLRNALQSDPSHRTKTAAQFAAALQRILLECETLPERGCTDTE